MNRSVDIVAPGLIAGAANARAQQNSAALDKLFARAHHKATVEGDLTGAIEDYKRIVATAPVIGRLPRRRCCAWPSAIRSSAMPARTRFTNRFSGSTRIKRRRRYGSFAADPQRNGSARERRSRGVDRSESRYVRPRDTGRAVYHLR